MDLSDYQALSELFPVVYKPGVSDTHQRVLWGLEGIGSNGAELIESLSKDFPIRIDYVVVIGDQLSDPVANLHPVASGGADPFVRVYRGDHFFRR